MAQDGARTVSTAGAGEVAAWRFGPVGERGSPRVGASAAPGPPVAWAQVRCWGGDSEAVIFNGFRELRGVGLCGCVSRMGPHGRRELH